jgi:proteasome accessory factor C
MAERVIEDAAAQLHRLLLAIPALADDKPHPIADVARSVGTDDTTLTRDLRTLVTRFEDGPPGFMDGVQVLLAADTVQVRTTAFRRPMGLSRSELRALELGLAMLRHEVAPHEQSALEQAHARVTEAAMRAARDGAPGSTRAARIARKDEGARLAELRTAIKARRQATIRYRSANSTKATTRTVHPYGTVYSRGRWFLIAFCDKANGLRVFRVDRVSSVTVHSDRAAKVAEGLSLSDLLDHGRVMATKAIETVRIRYSARIARWIAEREDGQAEPDGGLIVEHPLADDEWAVRHVLQYGPEAEVLAPARVRALVASRLHAIVRGS